jgi:glutaredoxin
MSSSHQLRGGAWLALLALTCAIHCESKPKPNSGPASEAPSLKPESNELPQLQLRDETPDLLLTWVDDKGDFHVVQAPSEVPENAREQVRVVITTKEEGTGRLVYVANLSAKAADGTYPVRTLTRAQWNELGADRRKVRMDVLAAENPLPSASAVAKAPTEVSPEEKKLNGKVIATVYGAEWCKPCHDAEAFLKRLGVNVTKKDIEESRAARAEMERKLMAAGRMGASIPVIDVAGQVFIGFSQGALKQAVESARKPETL